MRTEIAYAKINLALHVRARRSDGYHDLETLFAFCDFGDVLECAESDDFSFSVSGEWAAGLGNGEDNLAVRAARLIHGGHLPKLALHLVKNLPVAAGLGGGSADAAAVFRLLDARTRLDLAAGLGADVPACIASQCCIGQGTGTQLLPIENDVSQLHVLLVNPGIPLATGPVFRAWDGIDRGGLSSGSARGVMLSGRNDLEAAAVAIAPAIADVLGVLRATAPLVARMSGSGATCFALYESEHAAIAAEAQIPPEWWRKRGQLR